MASVKGQHFATIADGKSVAGRHVFRVGRSPGPIYFFEL